MPYLLHTCPEILRGLLFLREQLFGRSLSIQSQKYHSILEIPKGTFFCILVRKVACLDKFSIFLNCIFEVFQLRVVSQLPSMITGIFTPSAVPGTKRSLRWQRRQLFLSRHSFFFLILIIWLRHNNSSLSYLYSLHCVTASVLYAYHTTGKETKRGQIRRQIPFH